MHVIFSQNGVLKVVEGCVEVGKGSYIIEMPPLPLWYMCCEQWELEIYLSFWHLGHEQHGVIIGISAPVQIVGSNPVAICFVHPTFNRLFMRLFTSKSCTLLVTRSWNFLVTWHACALVGILIIYISIGVVNIIIRQTIMIIRDFIIIHSCNWGRVYRGSLVSASTPLSSLSWESICRYLS